jgi:hypothetical protein
VVGIFHNIHKSTAPTDKFLATLEPRALLCGTLDPSLNAAVTVAFLPGLGSSYQKAPRDGATVIAVVARDETGVGIVSDFCDFMPGQSSLVEIDGLGDPRVFQTLQRLQKARRNAEPNIPPATEQN